MGKRKRGKEKEKGKEREGKARTVLPTHTHHIFVRLHVRLAKGYEEMGEVKKAVEELEEVRVRMCVCMYVCVGEGWGPMRGLNEALCACVCVLFTLGTRRCKAVQVDNVTKQGRP